MSRNITVQAKNVAIEKKIYGVGDQVTVSDAVYAQLVAAGAVAKGLIVDNGYVSDSAAADAVAQIVGSAPAALDTFEEVAAALGTKATAQQGALAATALQPAASTYLPRLSMTGPAATDITSITPGSAADASFTESYIISANTLPAIWPDDAWGKMAIGSNTYGGRTAQSGIASAITHRFMCDGDAFSMVTNGTGFVADLFIDGRPYASNPVSLLNTTGLGAFGYLNFAFPSAKPRLIEFRSTAGVVAVYAKKPYRVWKPVPDLNPKVAVVGDSYVAPTTMNDATSGNVTNGFYDLGIYQRMPALLGITSLATDGIGGTGYIAGGGPSMPYGHATRIAWLQAINPDVIVVHGGGANDLFNSQTVAATVTAATNHFTNLRSLFPNAKLVFVEGLAPPGFTPATYNPNYIAVRQGVQSNLATAGVKAYFLDLATTRPPLNGSGYVTAANASGNSDIYVGSDTFHPTIKGNQFLRHVIAPKLARVLADDGYLAGSLIL